MNDETLQINLCNNCFKKKYKKNIKNNYAMDTIKCSECNKVNDCTNVYLYNIVTLIDIDINKEWYNNIPRVFDKEEFLKFV